MKKIRTITATLLAISVLGGPLASLAADQKAEPKAKPYPLKTCVVTDEKLGDMGDAYVFVHQGQEIKLCCKSCLKDFNKNPAKYMKKVQEAQAKAKK
ncbi:MAG TPA: hypothetical protein VNZ22_16495 [Bacillota bacterium]|nr:hypothetical protein [Bacillota bacterium]